MVTDLVRSLCLLDSSLFDIAKKWISEVSRSGCKHGPPLENKIVNLLQSNGLKRGLDLCCNIIIK